MSTQAQAPAATEHLTGPEHYREGQRLLAVATTGVLGSSTLRQQNAAQLAMVHFKAAEVAAQVYDLACNGSSVVADGWHDVAFGNELGTKAARRRGAGRPDPEVDGL